MTPEDVHFNGETCTVRRKLKYSLVNIVFHRDQVAGMDSIRGYDISGNPHLPVSSDSTYALPTVTVPQLRNGDRFFGLYVLTQDGRLQQPPFPESRQEINNDSTRSADEFLSRLREKIKHSRRERE